MVRFFKIILIIITYFSCFFSFSQESWSPVLNTLTEDNGLPSNVAYSVFKDQKGFIWFGTDNGAARYNGYKYDYFDTDKGLPSNSVFGFFQDEKERLWLRTFSNKLCYIENDSVFYPKVNDTLYDIIKGRIMNSLVVKNDTFCLGTIGSSDLKDGGIIVGTLSKVIEGITPNKSEDFYPVNVLEIDSNNFVYGSHGLSYNLLEKIQSQSLISFFDHQKILNKNQDPSFEQKIELTKAGTGFIDMAKDVKGNYAFIQKERLIIFNSDSIIQSFDDDHVFLTVNKFNNGFIAGGSGGAIYYFESNDEGSYDLQFKVHVNGDVSEVVEDVNNSFWVSTLNKGVFHISNKDVKALLSNKIPTSIESNDNAVYVGYEDGVVKRFVDQVVEDIQITSPYQKDIYVHSLSKGKNNEIYVGINQIGYYSINENTVRYQEIDKIGNFYAIEDDAKSYKKWLGNNVGFYLVDSNSVLYASNKNEYKGRINCIFVDKERVYIGAKNGFYYFTNNQLIQIDTTSKLANSDISDIIQDKNDNLIVSSFNEGLFVLKDDHIYNLDLRRIKTRSINKIGLNNNDLWIATTKGLYKIENYYDSKTRMIFHFDKELGLLSNNIKDFTFFENDIWMISDKGITVLPITMKPYFHISKPYFSNVTVNDKNQKIKNDYMLNYDQNNLIIEFYNTSFIQPCSFEYQLEGVDPNLIFTNDNIVRYPSLSPGNYTFKVRSVSKTNELSDWSYMNFKITKPIWREWYFYFVVLVSLIMISFFIITLRLKNRNSKLMLQQKLDELEKQALQSQMNPHFIFNSLNSIQFRVL